VTDPPGTARERYRFLDLRPDNVFAAAAFAELRLAQGRAMEADALAALARGVARPELALSRGLAAVLTDRPQEAQSWFDEALRIRPGQGRATVLSLALAVWGRDEAALGALDEAIRLGYRNADWLQVDPWLGSLREGPALLERVERIRGLVAAERQRVLAAPWLPPGLVVAEGTAPSAARR
jgi:tetratricopeptide (TPR) repeat protein